MNEEFIEQVYETLCGQLLPEYALPWVEDAFEPGRCCDLAYGEMLDAYRRLCGRLETEEDADAEIMIDALMRIQRELCIKMFDYGVKYAEIIKPRR